MAVTKEVQIARGKTGGTPTVRMEIGDVRAMVLSHSSGHHGRHFGVALRLAVRRQGVHQRDLTLRARLHVDGRPGDHLNPVVKVCSCVECHLAVHIPPARGDLQRDRAVG